MSEVVYTGNTVVVSPDNANAIFGCTFVEFSANNGNESTQVLIYDGGEHKLTLVLEEGYKQYFAKRPSYYFISNNEIDCTPCEPILPP